VVLVLVTVALVACASEPDPLVVTLRDGGNILFVRHAASGTEPDRTDDPADCAAQRNLNATGRADAATIGAAFEDLRLPVTEVRASRWCRALETAEIAFDEVAIDERLLPSAEGADTLLDDPPSDGNLVLVGHLSTITGLTGIHLEEGETAVFGPDGDLVTTVTVEDWEELTG
jgi:phosphohistidine phosphatase SixA